MITSFFSRDMASHLISVADETVKLVDKESGELLACYKGHSDPRYKDYKIEVGVYLCLISSFMILSIFCPLGRFRLQRSLRHGGISPRESLRLGSNQ